MAKHQYCEVLDEYISNTSKEYGRPIEPKFTALMDGAGNVFFFGSDNLSNEQRLQLLGKAFQQMNRVVEQEKKAMREAKPIDLSKLKRAD